MLFNLSGRNIYQSQGKTYIESRSSQFVSSLISVLFLSFTVVMWFMITEGIKGLVAVLIGLIALVLWWFVDKTFAWYALKFNSVIVNEPEAGIQVLDLPWLWEFYLRSVSKKYIYMCGQCGAVYSEIDSDASLLALLSGGAFVGLLYAVRKYILHMAAVPSWSRGLMALAAIMIAFVLFEALHWTLIKPSKASLQESSGVTAYQ